MTPYPFQLLQEHYKLANLAKEKLNQCISYRTTSGRKSEYNLREVVGHANLLDRVLISIDKIKYNYLQEQERKFRKRAEDHYYDSLYYDNYLHKYNNMDTFNDRLDVGNCGYITAASRDDDDYDYDNVDDGVDDNTRLVKGNSEDVDDGEGEDFIFAFSDTFPVSPIKDPSLTSPDNGYYKSYCNYYNEKVANIGNDLDHNNINLHPIYLDSVQSPLLSQHMSFPAVHYHKYV